MKNKLYILWFAVLFGSCDNFVDIVPKGQNIPTTVDDLAKIINYNNNIGGGGLNWYFMSDDIYFPATELAKEGVSAIKSYAWEPYMYSAIEKDEDWATMYREIYFANYVIEHILTAPESSSRMYNRNETYGRALLLRAYDYWYLVSAYAPLYDETEAATTLAVPMPLVSDINTQYPRSTVAAVYKQIFGDIDAALALDELPDWRKINIWPCKAAAYALLSRIYLYQGKWSEAAAYAQKMLDINAELNDYNEMEMRDPGNASAGVNGYYQNAIQDPEVILSKTAGNNFTSGYVSQALLDCYKDKQKDLRYRYLFSDKDRYGVQLPGYIRATDQQTFNGIRMSEVYLNRAEALVRMGGADNLAAAHALLTTLRSKRYENPDALPSMTQNELLEEVLLERRRELRFTCFRWFDMKRLKVTVTRQGINGETVTLTGDSPRYTWAIPLDVMEYNPQLVQNER